MRTLEIINFIKKYDNWFDILQEEPYMLKITRLGDLYMFNYNQIESQPCEIVNEARGLILEVIGKEVKVVRYGFYRFYNYGEAGAAEIGKIKRVTEKIDGSLVMFYYYNGWHMSTRNTFDAYTAPIGDTDKTFEEVIIKAFENSGISLSQFDKNFTYVFELVSPLTQVIVSYEQAELYYLMSRNNNTLEEVYNKNPKWKAPQFYELNDLTEIVDFCQKFEGKKFEGVVVEDLVGNRVKIKNLDWLRLHHLYNNGSVTTKRAYGLLCSGEYKEFLTYFPQHVDKFIKVAEMVTKYKMIANVYDNMNLAKTHTRKEWASVVKGLEGKIQTLAFKAYDKKAEEWINGLAEDDFFRKFLKG